ncbi:hypothetical protein SCLCIDRAFT_751358 [Scleroderma citrinum Foug A]|uniref:Uncharacterized protein n=1 Tax=Scleroderma citrinum Foug A TaxID=1036808 RepID=A0A0C3D411_9AGAM|nr:hypothetical protein SCLCIDRAFT_751358 [Scleroderma citrinum Foug A]
MSGRHLTPQRSTVKTISKVPSLCTQGIYVLCMPRRITIVCPPARGLFNGQHYWHWI